MEEVSLKDYFERILEEKDKAVNIALAAAKEAVGVAEANSQRWRENANEWRGSMNDRERAFLTRKEFYTMISTLIAVFTFCAVLFKLL